MPLSLIETHCHLDYLKDRSTQDTLELASQAGVEKLITISVGPNNWEQVASIAEKYHQVFYTLGIHPHHAHEMRPEHWPIFEQFMASSQKKLVALGEMGLDYHYMKTPREKQIAVFEQQIDLAQKYRLPIVIHSRDADEDMMAILKNTAPKLERKGVIHSFTSTQSLAELAIDLDFCLGINGIVTFKNAQEVQKIAAWVPLNRLLLETDSPFLAPVPHRGKENQPAWLAPIADFLCQLRQVDRSTLMKTVYENTHRLFGPMKIN